MAAPDLESLYKFESEFEIAAVAFLNTATGITVNRTIQTTDLETPRIEVRFELGAAQDPPTMRGGGASPTAIDYRAYDAMFSADILTDNAVGRAANHFVYRATVRVAMMRSADNWKASNLPYYDLKYLRPSGENYSTDGDFNLTEMSWELIFEIRDDAWPA